jgi:hypothetical protein
MVVNTRIREEPFQRSQKDRFLLKLLFR